MVNGIYNVMLSKLGLCTNGDPDLDVPQKINPKSSVFAAFGSFLAIFLITVIEHHTGYDLIIASFGASAMIIFFAPTSLAAQPRNALGGHVISAAVGVATKQTVVLVGNIYPPLAMGAAAGLSSLLMSLTCCGHPPGVATALVAYMESSEHSSEGFYYIVHPVATGICILISIALVYNNLSKERRYPTFWY